MFVVCTTLENRVLNSYLTQGLAWCCFLPLLMFDIDHDLKPFHCITCANNYKAIQCNNQNLQLKACDDAKIVSNYKESCVGYNMQIKCNI